MTKTKQIRVQVESLAYDGLKKKAKELRMTLEHYAGLRLSGYEITRTEYKPEIKEK